VAKAVKQFSAGRDQIDDISLVGFGRTGPLIDAAASGAAAATTEIKADMSHSKKTTSPLIETLYQSKDSA
jgi:hypothetical protein